MDGFALAVVESELVGPAGINGAKSRSAPPFTESRDGKLDGLAIRLVLQVQHELGSDYPVRLYPLKRVLALTQVEPGYELFLV